MAAKAVSGSRPACTLSVRSRICPSHSAGAAEGIVALGPETETAVQPVFAACPSQDVDEMLIYFD